MSRLTQITITTALLISTGTVANPLLGTWEYVEGKYATEAGYVSAKAPELTSVKIISDSHFSYITQKQGKFLYAGGGPYKLENNYFMETVAYGNVESLLGKTMAFSYKIEGNLWHHTLYENGKLVESEIWKRMNKRQK